MACRTFSASILQYGAIVFRIFFAFGTDYMLEYAWIKIAGGLAILGTAYAFRKQLTPGFLKKKEPKIKYKEAPYKFNLSPSGGGKGKQANEIKNRNIYTGKLIKKK